MRSDHGAALLAAGCGGSDDETSGTSEWASSVCSAASTWSDSVSTAVQSLQGGDLSEDSIKSAVDDVSEATKTLADDLQDAGKPDTEDGQQAQDLLDQLGQDVEDSVDEIEGAVDDASSTGIAAAISPDHDDVRHDEQRGRRHRRPARAAGSLRRADGRVQERRRVLEPEQRRVNLGVGDAALGE